jgi:AcrR family transcriptional regulator
MASPGTRKPRRLDPATRRDQLVDAAVAVVAEHGHGGLNLDRVAERADVTRGLIYHYFPRGRQDLFLAVVDRAGHVLTDDWLVDSDMPADERLAANFSRIIEHALEPSEAWLVHRQAGVAGDPEVNAIAERYRSIVIAAMAQNNFGTAEPPAIARAALGAYLDFAERALDEWRRDGLDPETLPAILTATLLAVVAAVRDAG